MNKRVNSIKELKEKSIIEGIIDSEELEEAISIDNEQENEFIYSDDEYEAEEGFEAEELEEDDDLSYEIETEGEQLRFISVIHTKRAEKFGGFSDGEMSEYANIALEYFGNRCALSGEKLIKFDENVNGKNSNLSAEHVVALSLGGNDIVPNIVPTVLQYNIQKNGYNTIDWWKQAKDITGKEIYSPYRLLKLSNFMLKSLSIRKEFLEKQSRFPTPEEYRERLFEENDIDRYLREIEKQDEKKENNKERKILSDTITATTIDIDQKKILTQIPSLERGIPTAKVQSQDKIRYTENQFLFDSIEEIRKEKVLGDLSFEREDGSKVTLLEELELSFKEIEPVISFENKIRTLIVNELEKLGIENTHSVAQILLKDSTILENAKKIANEESLFNSFENIENAQELSKNISNYLNKQIIEISKEFNMSEKEAKSVLAYVPGVIYDEKEKDMLQKLILFKNESNFSFEEVLTSNAVTQIKNVMEIEEWCKEKFEGKPEYLRRMPRKRIDGVKAAKEDEQETKEQRELRLGTARNTIYQKYKDKNKEELNDVEKELLERLEKITKEYDINPYLANVMEIEEWCKEEFEGKPKYLRRMPRMSIKGVSAVKKGEQETKEQRELRLGNARNTIYKKYKDKNKEELSDIEKELLERLEKTTKEYDINSELANVMEIEEWCKEEFEGKPKYLRRMPRTGIKGVRAAKEGEEETKEQRELRLGQARNNIYQKYKDKNKEELSDIEKELLERLEKTTKEYDLNLVELGNNIIEIEEWCKEEFEGKPEYLRRMPRMNIKGVRAAKEGEEETKEQRELRLGKARNNIYQKYKDKNKEELSDIEKELLERLEKTTKEYDINSELANVMEIEEWCKEEFEGKPKYLRRMPRMNIKGVRAAKEGEEETKEQRELRLGQARSDIYQKYKNKKEEELSDIEKELLERLEKTTKEYDLNLVELGNNIIEIEEWCKEEFEGKPEYLRRMPRTKIAGVRAAKEGEEETKEQRELRLGKARSNIYQKYKNKKEEELSDVEKELLGRLERIEEEYGNKGKGKEKMHEILVEQKEKEELGLNFEVEAVFEDSIKVAERETSNEKQSTTEER